MDVFNNLRHESKLKLIREEVMTLALERRLNDTSAAESAFADALEMCGHHTFLLLSVVC